MPVTVRIPTPLRPFTAQQAVVHVEGATVGQVLDRLTSEYVDLKPHLFASDGSLRSFVNVYVNDEDVRYLDRERTAVGAADTVSIVPSVAGGTDAVAAPADPAALSHEEVRRYSRHLIMPEIGVEGQKRLKAARVLCIGAGGLGSPASLYLTAAGVGTLGLVDFDTVDFSNLQRQILYIDGGRRSAASSRRPPNGSRRPQSERARRRARNAADVGERARDLFAQYDVIVDGADNFPTRYLVNDACVLLGKPNAYGSIFRFDGQASVFATKDGPCYRCLYPEPPPPGLVPSCAEGGVLGVLPGLVGTIQATEAIKIITGAGQTLAGRLLLLDALTMEFRTVKLRRDPACPICGDRPTIKALIDYEQFCGVAPAATAAAASTEPEITVEELKARLDRGTPTWILDVREPREFDICRIPGSTLIPLGELPKRLAEIPSGPDAPDIVVHCKMGGRSAKAVALLRQHGYARASNLTGGILAWIAAVDPTLPKY